MKKLVYILFLSSNIVFSQSLSNLDTLSGFDKYKFGTSPSDYTNLDENNCAFITLTCYKVNEKNYNLNDVDISIEDIAFEDDKKLKIINLHTEREFSRDSFDEKFNKIVSYYENLFGKDYTLSNGGNKIDNDSIYTTYYTWESKTKKAVVLTKNWYIINNEPERGVITISYQLRNEYKKNNQEKKIEDITWNDVLLRYYNEYNNKETSSSWIEGYEEFKFGTSILNFKKIKKNKHRNGQNIELKYKGKPHDVDGIKVEEVILTFNSDKKEFPLYEIQVISAPFETYEKAKEKYEEISQFYEHQYLYTDKYEEYKINRIMIMPLTHDIINSISFLGGNRLFSINVKYSEKSEKYMIFMDYFDYNYSNYTD